jgi:hypothetical protein
MADKDLSPQQSILTHSYDEEEFDLPQVRIRSLCTCVQCTLCSLLVKFEVL